MDFSVKKAKKYRGLRVLLVLLLLGISGKFLLVHLGGDEQYQMVMGYRMLQGDTMFSQMLEPHQTSAYPCVLLMQLYLWMTGTTSGIVLFLRGVSLLVKLGISLFLYRGLKGVIDAGEAGAAAVLFYLVSPKDIVLLEYADLQLYFSIFCGLFLYSAFHAERAGARRGFLCLAALSLCGIVLAYPSALLVYPGCAALILIYSRHKAGDLTLFTAVCGVCGGCYGGYFLWRDGLDVFAKHVELMLALEPLHTKSAGEKFVRIAGELGACGAILLGIAAAALCLGFLWTKYLRAGERGVISAHLFLIMSMVYVLVRVFTTENIMGYGMFYPAVILWGTYFYRNMKQQQKCMYHIGMVLGLSCFAATLLLSDLDVTSSFPYLIFATIVSFVPVCEHVKNSMKLNRLMPSEQVEEQRENKGLRRRLIEHNRLTNITVCLVFAVIMIRALYLFWPWNGLVKKGPDLGILDNYVGAYMQTATFEEYTELVEGPAKLYLVGDEGLDLSPYLYPGVTCAAPSVMSTPSYNEAIGAYWRLHPEKEPDVVMVFCWYGQLMLDEQEDAWILNWLENDFKASRVVDGKYWRYYIK